MRYLKNLNDMKQKHWWLLLALIPVLVAAALVTPGLPTSRYPNIVTADDSDLLNIARTNTAIGLGVRTNHNMLMRDVFRQSTNGLATIAYVTTTSNSIVSANVFRTNQWTTNIAGTPVNGAVRFQGYPSLAFVTNNARNATFEWEPTNQSVRIGSLGNVGFDLSSTVATSNYWDNPNIGFLSWAGGTNVLVNAPYSAIMWATRSLIFTNAGGSFIGGGTNNVISTNSTRSVIVGGRDNIIETDAAESIIGGGSGNTIDGASQNSAIVGGTGNVMSGGANSFSFIGGGVNNAIGTAGEGSGVSHRSVVGGGEQNRARGRGVFIGGGRQNLTVQASDFSVIAGGSTNTIGTTPSTGSSHTTIGGGSQNLITDSSDYSVIAGGRLNTAGNGSSNAVISGGSFNTCNGNRVFEMILGGERNTVGGSYSFAIGSSNSVTGKRSGAIGTGLTVATDDTISIGGSVVLSSGNITYASPTTILGAGNGNTNYTLLAGSSKMYLGSSNVNISAVMQTSAGQIQRWRVAITNDSPDTWGFSASSVTNRWFWQSNMYGTNAPVVLTNNTRLVIDGESEGTNTWAVYRYYAPAK